MGSFLFIFLLCGLFIQTLSRPQLGIEDNEDEGEEKGYDDVEVAAADEDTREDDLADKKQDSSDRQETMQVQNLETSGDRTYSERKAANDPSMQENSEYFTEYKPNKSRRLQVEKDISDENESDYSSLKNIQNTYVKNSDTIDKQDTAQHSSCREVNADNINEKDFLSNKANNNQVHAHTEDNMLFGIKNEISNIERKKFNTNEMQNSNEGTYSKSYSNSVDPSDRENLGEESDNSRLYFLNRDTRQAKDIPQESKVASQEIDNNELGKTLAEDEESAIKKYIGKLSKEELKELKDSLSDDKKLLLQNVIKKIDSSQNNYDENINKREITKKAGAIEEAGLMDSELSKLVKNQGVTSDLEIGTESLVSQNTKNQQTESQPENSSMPTTKSVESTESENKSVTKTDTGDINLKNKRETNSANFAEMLVHKHRESQNRQELSNEKQCDYFQDEDSSQFANDESQSEYNRRNKKREINVEYQTDFCDSFKSLEDSFPHFNTNDGSNAYSGPLIRVKRKSSDQVVKKRSAGVLPDAKVAYFPYKSENDDEENDESNEFDDEGFYDRTSNFVKENQPVENLSDEKSSLGSDTDSVLSGVEDVDGNLMFRSGLRDKRTARVDNTLATDDHSKSSTENSLSPLNYQENDAFGPLPRNYEGDLGRYKRIRRLQQSQSSMEENI